jgi:site-specific recombinase XerD
MPTDVWRNAILLYELTCQGEGQSERTIRTRLCSVRSMACKLGTAGPAEITKNAMVAYLAAEVRRRKGAGPATHFADCRSFWSWWSKENLAVSPMEDIKRPRNPVKTDTHVLTNAELKAVSRACSGTSWMERRDRAIVLMLMATPTRLAELAALKVDDIDLHEREGRITRGKGGKGRDLVFGHETALALARWLAIRAKRAPDSEFLFTGRTGRPLTGAGIAEMLARLGKKAEVPGLRAHLFRHRWVHQSLENGMSEGDICNLAGWDSRKQLERYGASLASNRARAAAHANPVKVF